MINIPKISCFVLLLFIGSTTLLAQTKIPGKLNWSDEYKEPRGAYLSKIVTQNADGYYVLREKTPTLLDNGSTSIFIEHYDKNMKLKKAEEFNLRYEKKNRDFENVIVVGGEMYLLSSFHNQKHKKKYLFAQKITHRLRLVDKLIKIGEISTKSILNEGGFDYHISADSSKILIYNSLPYKKGEPERFAFNVYDTEFNKLWSKNIRLPYNDELFSIQEYQVDKAGNVYLLGIIHEKGFKIIRSAQPTYTYTVLAYTNNGEEKKEYKIKLNDNFITDFTFNVANDGHLVCSGFYSEKGTYSIKGTYFFRINSETKEMYNKNLKAFDIDFITEHLKDRKKERVKKADATGKKNKSAELFRYDLDELILRSDGGALLIAEQYYIERRTVSDYNAAANRTGGNISYQYHYYYNDIIIVNIKPSGEIEWASRIPKRQHTVNDNGYFSSYTHSIVKDKIYFVYNENRRNFESDKKRIYNFDGKNSVIALSEVSKDGSVRAFPLENNRDANIITRPKVCKQTGKNEMVIYGEYGRRYRFGKLELK